MRMTVFDFVWLVTIAVIASCSLAAIAVAAPVAAVPGPLAGVGLLPVIAAGAGAYWLFRKLRNK